MPAAAPDSTRSSRAARSWSKAIRRWRLGSRLLCRLRNPPHSRCPPLLAKPGSVTPLTPRQALHGHPFDGTMTGRIGAKLGIRTPIPRQTATTKTPWRIGCSGDRSLSGPWAADTETTGSSRESDVLLAQALHNQVTPSRIDPLTSSFCVTRVKLTAGCRSGVAQSGSWLCFLSSMGSPACCGVRWTVSSFAV